MTCCCLFADDHGPSSEVVLREVCSFGAYVPNIWWAEMRNVLITSERRRRITPAETGASLFLLKEVDILIDSRPDERSVLELARRHRLTVYDALYLELAARRNIALATLDHALIRAADAEQISLAS